MLYSFLCLLQWESAGNNLLDIDLAAADQPDSPWPSVSVPEQELESDLVGGEMHERDLLEVGTDTNDKDETTCGSGVGSGLDGAFDTGAFHCDGGLDFLRAFGDVFAGSTGEDFANFGGEGEGVFLGVDLVGEGARNNLFGEIETVLNNVSDDDGSGTGCSSTEELNDSNGTCTSDQNWSTEADFGLEGGLEGDREWFEKSNLFVRHVVGHLVQPTSRVLVVSLEGSILRRDGVEVDCGAKVVLAGTAVVASSLEARHTGLNGNTVTRGDVVNALANSDDDASGFVTERTLVLDLPRTETGVLPEVDVRATDTGCADVDESHAGTRGLRRGLDQLELLLVSGPGICEASEEVHRSALRT